MTIRIALPLLAMIALSACNRPVPPAPDTPPEPQATELRDAIQKPIDRARSVSDTLQQSADARAAEADRASGDTPPPEPSP
ncbi:hypothetical protein [Stenotrophomonas sp. TWI1183]|jgi:hypothetical protein|uniref:hypothetical protein n=1 Tax=unclassified Stenotrophomonas TaxID=196198 RepID=UPI00320B2436